MTIPTHVDNYGAIPERLRPLYEFTGDGYRLSVAGSQLARYRKLIAADPYLQPAAPPNPVKLDRLAWAHLVAAAEPKERPWLLRQAAAGRFKIGP